MEILDTNALVRAKKSLVAKHGDNGHAKRLFFEDVTAEVCRQHTHVEAGLSKQTVSEFTTPTSTVTGSPTNNIIDNFNNSKSVDMGWQMGYQVIDFTNTNKSGFDVNTTTNGIVVSTVEPGENAKVFSVVGTQATTLFLKKRGGFAYDNTWWDDEEFYKINEQAEDMIGAAMREKSNVAYGILETAADVPADIAYAGASGDSEAIRDAKTFYNAVVSIVQSTEDNGIGSTVESQFVLFSPLELWQRALTANAVTPQITQTDGGPLILPSRITVVPTNRLTSSTEWVMCLPGQQTKWGDRQTMTVEEEADIQKDARLVVSTERYNGVAGNTNQMRIVTSSAP